MNFAIGGTVLFAIWVLSTRAFTQAEVWKAMITPLASIIGSGFLIVGPILGAQFGILAPFVMLILCGIAYAFGHVIRFNIRQMSWQTQASRLIDTVSEWTLGFAYMISVTYYLNLFGAFAVRLTAFQSEITAKLITSVVFGGIFLLGWAKGFKALERTEILTVNIKLAIIASLLMGLLVYGVSHDPVVQMPDWPYASLGLESIFLVFGLLVTVQGFETSRYLGDIYQAEVRIRSMRLAQFGSTLIYLAYISLLVCFIDIPREGVSETEIITLMSIVSPILPVILVLGALTAQSSAAVADTAAAGGLFVELSNNRIQSKHAYLILTVLGVLLTWALNIFEIVAFASRAFAFYYALQAALAAYLAYVKQRNYIRFGIYSALAVLGLLIAALGTSIE